MFCARKVGKVLYYYYWNEIVVVEHEPFMQKWTAYYSKYYPIFCSVHVFVIVAENSFFLNIRNNVTI